MVLACTSGIDNTWGPGGRPRPPAVFPPYQGGFNNQKSEKSWRKFLGHYLSTALDGGPSLYQKALGPHPVADESPPYVQHLAAGTKQLKPICWPHIFGQHYSRVSI